MLQKMLFFCERAETDRTECTARLLVQVVRSSPEGAAFVSRFDIDHGFDEHAVTPLIKTGHETSELVVCIWRGARIRLEVEYHGGGGDKAGTTSEGARKVSRSVYI
jgi:hypothetical protein